MKLRVLAFALAILAFFIFVGSPFQQAAQAVAVVDDAIIAILIAALAAIGITFVTTGAYATVQEYVESLFIDYANDHNTTPSMLLAGTQSGTDKLGRLILNNRFVVLISSFASWLRSTLNLVDNESLTLQSIGNAVGGMVVYETPLYIYRDVTGASHLCYVHCTIDGATATDIFGIYTDDPDTQAYITKSDYRNTQTVKWTFYDVQTGSVITERYWNNWGQLIGGYNISPWFVLTLSYGNNIRPINGINAYSQEYIGYILSRNTDVDFNPTGIRIDTGDIAIPLDDDNYNDGDGAIIDTGAEWGSSYGDVIEGIEDGFSDSETLDPSITYEGEQEVTDQIEDTQADSVSQSVSDYQVAGLTTVFPFCIPFDLYNFVACLAADPVAPSFTWRFYVPGICDEEIEIDLSEFDAAAQILRTMELLLFCVGLAFVTRKIIRG